MASSMKFVVPLRMPPSARILSLCAAMARLCRKGTPPPQAAENRKDTPFSRASFASSIPCAATSALFEVTTCLPASRAIET